ncbi:hypothetical protein HMPREF9447_03089 [Bacteroides oleiciplenus YIT 12058]|uniref:Uncharacterized protein n=1 Tax=Bacteroides oleiciplenus YIT 12058 TaxID=742727 RepID=K9E1T1_9BACE|nr:hypothetical protein HMPREF9447_03089 [Bacteroides oleiciplenus YIT 12058]
MKKKARYDSYFCYLFIYQHFAISQYDCKNSFMIIVCPNFATEK